MKKNEVIRLEIEDLNNLGFGVAHVEGKVVFVSGAVTGDVVMAQIIKVNASYCVAILKQLLVRSSQRTEGRCIQIHPDFSFALHKCVFFVYNNGTI